MTQEIGPSSPWCLEYFVADFYRTFQGHSCTVKSGKGCTVGNFVKTTFHEKENHASVILEIIHPDMCGTFLISSTEKHRYYVIFVDDYSRRGWIFFM